MSNPLSISAVIDLPEDTWIDEGFTGVVREITERKAKKSGKKFWVLTIADPDNGSVVEAACFTYPKLNEGDQIDVTGKGIKRQGDFHGTVKVVWGEDSEVKVIGNNVVHQEASTAAAKGATLPAGGFHVAMKKEAMVYAHCIYYAVKVLEKLAAAGMPDIAKQLTTPESIRAIATGLSIRAAGLGLHSIVPALGAPVAQPEPSAKAEQKPVNHTPAPAAARPAAPRNPTDEQLANRHDAAGREVAVDEDSLPF